MTQTSPNSGEYASSTEFLKEYGNLIIDASNLIEKLGSTVTPTAESHIFSLERIENPIKVPTPIAEAIGEVNAASIAYDTSPEVSSITVELFGAEKSYRISRSTQTQTPEDTVIDIKPVDVYTAALFTTSAYEKKPYIDEPGETFEKRIHNIPGVDNADFVRLLLDIARPNATVESSDAITKQLAETNPFSEEIYRLFIDSSSINAHSAQSFTEYNFVADDTAALVFSEENGSPSYFQFTCADSNGDALNIRGTLHQGVELEYPRHAVKNAGSYGEVDTMHSFPLSFAEVKYIRQLFQEELASLPATEIIQEELTSQADAFVSTIGVDEELIGELIEDENEEAELEDNARHGALNDELARLIDEQEKDS